MNEKKYIYKNDDISFYSCFYCKNKYINDIGCKAFDEIPTDILTGEFDHTVKHPDQKNDIVFEPITKEN